MEPSDQLGKSAWMLASIAVVVAALYLAKSVLVPMTLAVLLSFLLSFPLPRIFIAGASGRWVVEEPAGGHVG